VVQRLFALIRLRNTHPAFGGTFEVIDSPAHELRLHWSQGTQGVRLMVDLRARRFELAVSNAAGVVQPVAL
jgi:sucrose phosphorylase